ncbi:MAG: hypothetical protein ACLT8O_02225 [Blautia massiliensis (ex Durand et al. 2017)]
MLKTGDEIPEDAFSKVLVEKRETCTAIPLAWIVCRTTSFCVACKGLPSGF